MMVSEKSLRAAAKELNKVLDLEPPIAVTADLKDLTKEFQEVLDDPQINLDEFEFSEATQAVIDEFMKPELEPEEKKVTKRTSAAPKDKEPTVHGAVVEDDDAPIVKKGAKKVVTEDDDDEPEEKATAKKAEKPVKKEKAEKVPSPYGTSVEVMCGNPDMPIEKLIKELNKRGIDTDAGKSAVNTGYGVVRKIVSLLRKNGLMK